MVSSQIRFCCTTTETPNLLSLALGLYERVKSSNDITGHSLLRSSLQDQSAAIHRQDTTVKTSELGDEDETPSLTTETKKDALVEKGKQLPSDCIMLPPSHMVPHPQGPPEPVFSP